MTTYSNKTATNYIRLSLLLLILPILYFALWVPISSDETLTYLEKVNKLMSYFPELLRNPFWISFSFFGMCLVSAIFSFYAYMKSVTLQSQIVSVIICGAATFLTAIFGMIIL